MKTSAISLRLDEEQARQVKALADKFGVIDAQIIRWAVDALIEYVARHHGHLHLPIDFDVMWQQVRATAASHHVSLAATLGEEPGDYKAGRRTA